MDNDKVALRVVAVVAAVTGAFLVFGAVGHLAAVVNVKDAQGRPFDSHFLHLLAIGAVLFFVGGIDVVSSWRMWRGSTYALLLSTVTTLVLAVYLGVLLSLPPRGDPIDFFLAMQICYLAAASVVALYLLVRRTAASRRTTL